jgi:hypothetical protein
MILISVLSADEQEHSLSSDAARWILQYIQRNAGVEVQLLDAQDAAKLILDCSRRETDGLVVVTSGFDNRSALLLTEVLDTICPKWNRSTIGYVRYGSGDEQSRPETSIKLQLAEVRPSVEVPIATLQIDVRDGVVDQGIAGLRGPARQMVDDLMWWISALRLAPIQLR